MIAGSIVICSAILVGRHRREMDARRSIRAAEVRQALWQAHGFTSDRLDNLFANADQYLWLQRATVAKAAHLSIRIDASINRVIFLAAADATECHMTLQQPDGRPLDPKSSMVYEPAIDHAQVIEVKHPAVGDWAINFTANDEVQVAVRAESAKYPISIERADVIPAKHAAAAPVSVEDLRCCKADEPAEIQLGVRGPLVSEINILVQTIDGRALARLTPESATRAPRSLKGEFDYTYSAHFPFPRGPFYLMLEGIENGNGPFRRFSPELFAPISYRS